MVSTSTGTGERVASASTAAPRPRSVSTAGWIPRASSRRSSRAAASSSRAATRTSSAPAGSELHLRLREPQRERQRDEPLLGAVVEVPLEPAPRFVAGLDDPGSRRSDLLLLLPALGDVGARDEDDGTALHAEDLAGTPRDDPDGAVLAEPARLAPLRRHAVRRRADRHPGQIPVVGVYELEQAPAASRPLASSRAGARTPGSGRIRSRSRRPRRRRGRSGSCSRRCRRSRAPPPARAPAGAAR